MDPARDANKDSTPVTTEKKIEDLYALIRGLGFCMMTTRCPKTGRLVSRAMSPRAPEALDAPADLYFFANNASHKFEELEADPNVNLAFHNHATSEWISISGTAKIVNDREKIKELYGPDLKAWFGDLKDGVHDGGPNDPRMSLIFVTADTVHYCYKDTLAPLQIWRITKGMVTGEVPHVAAERTLEKDELQHGRNISKMGDSIVD